MPHLILEFTPKLPPEIAQQLADRLAAALSTIRREDGTHEFPPDGTSVRGYMADVVTLGGAGSDAVFVHATLKIRQGRSDDVITETGDNLLSVMSGFLREALPAATFRISVEVRNLTRMFT